MGKQSTSRERILQEGVVLMSQQGITGVTLGHLADAVGMSKSGVFAHFRSKEEVQIGLLERTAQFALPLIVEPAMTEPEGLPRLEALVGKWFGWAQRAGLPGGCPVAAGMFELDDVEGPVRDKLLRMENEWRELLTQLTRDAINFGHLRTDVDAGQFVWDLCGIYLNHHVTSRFLRHTDADDRAQAAFQSLVERSRPVR